MRGYVYVCKCVCAGMCTPEGLFLRVYVYVSACSMRWLRDDMCAGVDVGMGVNVGVAVGVVWVCVFVWV